ncbi:MAG: hypothetical protein RR581_06880 [Eubacterium sp.]
MFRITDTFRSEKEGYITIPTLRRFLKDVMNTSMKALDNRESLIKKIEEYADINEENNEKVLSWVDDVLKEGIKDIYVKKIKCDLVLNKILKNPEKLEEKLNPSVIKGMNGHFCGNQYNKKLGFVGYSFNISEKNGDYISIQAGELLEISDIKGNHYSTILPMCIDIYIDLGLIVVKAKSKSNMYQYMGNEFDLSKATRTTTEKEINKAIEKINRIFGFEIQTEEWNFNNNLYNLLEKYTETPQVIKDSMMNKNNEIEIICRSILENICGISHNYYDDIKADVENMVEKYFSISYNDKDIFINDRDAYPLKIAATDEEDSKVEQIAGFQEPLQSKAVFFDNKKMMQKSRLCDGIYFKFNRKDDRYITDKMFNVKIVAKGSLCIFKFSEYTFEEDINNVLFSLIKAV